MGSLQCDKQIMCLVGLGRLFDVISVTVYKNTSICIACVCAPQRSMAAPGQSMDYHGGQAASKKNLTNSDLKCGVAHISTLNSTYKLTPPRHGVSWKAYE